MAWLLYVEGKLLEIQNRFDDAHPVYQAAIAQARKAEGPASSAAIEIQIALAKELMFRQRIDEGQLLGDAAIATLQSTRRLTADSRGSRKGYACSSTSSVRGMQITQRPLRYWRRFPRFLKSQSSAIPIDVLAEIDFRSGVGSLRGMASTRWQSR